MRKWLVVPGCSPLPSCDLSCGVAGLDGITRGLVWIMATRFSSTLSCLMIVHANHVGPFEQIASLDPSVPVIADADTGYGGPIMVSRTVTQYARAGVAALHIEDQVGERSLQVGRELLIRNRLSKSDVDIYLGR